MCNGNCALNGQGGFNFNGTGNQMTNNLGWSDVGDLFENVIDGFGTQFQANANNAQANVDYNRSVADAIAAKSKLQAQNAERMYNVATIAVVGILVIIALYYASKILLKK